MLERVSRFIVPSIVLACAGPLMLAGQARADLQMPLDYFVSGAYQPAGQAPWVSASFTEISGGVRLSITSHLLEGESITRFLFNVAEPTRGSQLMNTNTSGPSWFQILGKVTNPGEVFAFQAPEDGYFDFRIDWHPNIFNRGDTFEMNFIGAHYTTGMFDTISEGGILRAAALVRGPEGDLGWVGNIPTPSAALALLGGLVAFGTRRRS